MKKRLLLLVLAALCLNFIPGAQSQTRQIKPLKIGDSIPEGIWKMPLQVINHPTGKQILTLNDYRDRKLIILDFWATYCSPCVASIDKIQLLQSTFSRDVLMLPVLVSDSRGRAEPFMKKRGWTMPSVFNDTILNKIVFSNYLTGYGTAWIYEGKLFSVPLTSGYINKSTIREVLVGRSGQIQIRKKLSFDPLRPLFRNNNAPAGLYFRNKHSVIARHLENFGTQLPVLKYDADTTILYAINLTIEQLFYEAFKPSIFPLLHPDSAIVWKISSSLHDNIFNRPAYSSKQYLEQELARQDWLKRHTYGYNLRYPERIKKSEALYFMQQDLNVFFGTYLNLTAAIEKGEEQYYAVLRCKNSLAETTRLLETKPEDQLGTARSSQRHNAHYTQHFLSKISRLLKVTAPALTFYRVLDSTGIDPDFRVDFDLQEQKVNSLDDLKQILAAYGLELFLEKKRTDILVIKEKTKL